MFKFYVRRTILYRTCRKQLNFQKILGYCISRMGHPGWLSFQSTWMLHTFHSMLVFHYTSFSPLRWVFFINFLAKLKIKYVARNKLRVPIAIYRRSNIKLFLLNLFKVLRHVSWSLAKNSLILNYFSRLLCFTFHKQFSL